MNGPTDAREDQVGPVLEVGEPGRAVVTAIRRLNKEVQIIDRGSYWRVLAPQRCVVTRVAIEQILGSPFVLPADLERVMPSFKGRFSVDENGASWSFGKP